LLTITKVNQSPS